MLRVLKVLTLAHSHLRHQRRIWLELLLLKLFLWLVRSGVRHLRRRLVSLIMRMWLEDCRLLYLLLRLGLKVLHTLLLLHLRLLLPCLLPCLLHVMVRHRLARHKLRWIWHGSLRRRMNASRLRCLRGSRTFLHGRVR